MKLSDLDFYQSPWLSLPDLAGRAVRVAISEVRVEEMKQRDGTKARKAVLSFSGKKKRLICNVSQARAAVEAWGDDLERWIGKQAILQPGKAENGKDTIMLIPVPPAAPEPPAAQPGALQPDAPGNLQPPAAAPEPPAAPGVWPPMTEAEAAALWAKEPT